MSNMRSPLSQARGLGSASEGVHHWWVQRVSAIALVPLSLWFMWSVVCLAGGDYATAQAWLASPCNATMMVLLVGTMFYHSQLGLQVVIEDYISHEGARLAALLAAKFINFFLAVAGIIAVLRVAVAGA